jgi:hypothetical protein
MLRWVVLFSGLLLVVPTLASAACDGDGICETGENLEFCYDCITAYCGDITCDQGLGEHLYGQATWCQSDCGVQNGQPCIANGQCMSGNCCGAPNGICVATIECQPGATQPCSNHSPRMKRCNSNGSWGPCTPGVECVQNSHFHDNIIGTTGTCPRHPPCDRAARCRVNGAGEEDRASQGKKGTVSVSVTGVRAPGCAGLRPAFAAGAICLGRPGVRVRDRVRGRDRCPCP